MTGNKDDGKCNLHTRSHLPPPFPLISLFCFDILYLFYRCCCCHCQPWNVAVVRFDQPCIFVCVVVLFPAHCVFFCLLYFHICSAFCACCRSMCLFVLCSKCPSIAAEDGKSPTLREPPSPTNRRTSLAPAAHPFRTRVDVAATR